MFRSFRLILKFWVRDRFGATIGLRIFWRRPQLQCRGYWVAGPYQDLKDYRPADWNEIVVVVTGQTARCTCNGEVLEEAMPLPASGPIGLEGDRGQMEYRRIRIQRKER